MLMRLVLDQHLGQWQTKKQNTAVLHFDILLKLLVELKEEVHSLSLNCCKNRSKRKRKRCQYESSVA